jgi:hypothetical protein
MWYLSHLYADTTKQRQQVNRLEGVDHMQIYARRIRADGEALCHTAISLDSMYNVRYHVALGKGSLNV